MLKFLQHFWYLSCNFHWSVFRQSYTCTKQVYETVGHCEHHIPPFVHAKRLQIDQCLQCKYPIWRRFKCTVVENAFLSPTTYIWRSYTFDVILEIPWVSGNGFVIWPPITAYLLSNVVDILSTSRVYGYKIWNSVSIFTTVQHTTIYLLCSYRLYLFWIIVSKFQNFIHMISLHGGNFLLND